MHHKYKHISPVIHDISWYFHKQDTFFLYCIYQTCLADQRLTNGFVLVADLAGAIYVAPIANSNDGLSFEAIPLQQLGAPVAVDFDPVHQRIYFTDVLSKTIQRSDLDGSSQEVVIRLDRQSGKCLLQDQHFRGRRVRIFQKNSTLILILVLF